MMSLVRFILLFLFSFSVYAQDYHSKFKRIGILDGLSQNSANDIVQDNQGFIWIATQDGLNKFNGYQFKVFKHNRDDSSSIRNNFIYTLSIDHRGLLWIGSEYGIDVINPETEVINRFDIVADGYTGTVNPSIRSIVSDNDHQVWIATAGGLFKYSTETKNLKYYKSDKNDSTSISSNNVSKLFADRNGTIWIGSRNAISRYDKKTDSFINLKSNSKVSNALPDAAYLAICEDSERNMWFGGTNGVVVYNPEKGTFKRYQSDKNNPKTIPNNFVQWITEDKNRTVWVATLGGGLAQYDRESDSFISHVPVLGNTNSMSHVEIQTIFEDRTQVLWVGTNGGGISLLDTKPPKFIHITGENSDKNAISSNDIWGLLVDSKNQLWVGTNGGGLNILNQTTKQNTVISTNTNSPFKLVSPNVYSLAEDKKGNIWIGTDETLQIYNPKTNAVSAYPYSKYPVGFGQRIFYEDKKGNMWIGGFDGLGRFDYPSAKGKYYVSKTDSQHTITGGIVTSFLEDSEGLFWIGTSFGLNIMDVENGTFTRFTHDPDNSNSICYPSVQTLAEDSSGNIWIGTGLGLSVYNKRTKQFTSFFEQDGLPNACVYNILKGENNTFWASTNHGLTKFDPVRLLNAPIAERKNEFRNFTQDDGLQSNEFNHGAAFLAKNGEIFFGGINGFNRFFPSKVQDNPYIPKIAINAFKILDNPANLYELLSTGESSIKLSYLENVFSFEFTALDFTNPGNNQYAYKLEGFDPDWIYSGTRRFVSYTNLDAGDYVFHVKGSNNDFVWNQDGLTVHLTIVPPFWKTKIAYFFYVILFAFIVYLFIKWRALSLENEKRLLERLVQEKTIELKTSYEQLRRSQEQLVHTEKMRVIGQLASGIAHDINNILSIILGSSEILEAKTTDPENQRRIKTISKAATDGASIIRRLQEFSKNDQGTTTETVYLNEVLTEVLDMTSYLTLEKRKKEKIDIKFETHFGEIPPITGNASELRSVITNILINAVDAFHTNGKITISTEWINSQSQFVEIKIKDTGKGIPKEVKDRIFEPFFTTKGTRGSGLGLSQVYGIISRHQGKIFVESEPEQGTTFFIQIPVTMSADHVTSDQDRKSAETEKPTPIVHHAAKPHQTDGMKKLLLVVEDEEAIRGIYNDIIHEMDMEPIFAVSGEEGIEKWNTGHYDMVISDIGLPGISGWEFISKVRQDNQDVPILVITGWGNEITSQKVVENKVNKLITKPFKFDQLTHDITELLNLD